MEDPCCICTLTDTHRIRRRAPLNGALVSTAARRLPFLPAAPLALRNQSNPILLLLSTKDRNWLRTIHCEVQPETANQNPPSGPHKFGCVIWSALQSGALGGTSHCLEKDLLVCLLHTRCKKGRTFGTKRASSWLYFYAHCWRRTEPIVKTCSWETGDSLLHAKGK